MLVAICAEVTIPEALESRNVTTVATLVQQMLGAVLFARLRLTFQGHTALANDLSRAFGVCGFCLSTATLYGSSATRLITLLAKLNDKVAPSESTEFLSRLVCQRLRALLTLVADKLLN